ncbi:retropepsin-like aspartic protease [uncultured Paraglaciecola sp.]|uniref:retropepsin-like aspartic protease family protein n=1 Tax=uncultured Paraglaciecola sp. TaxID=1765024 RepID=UPI0030DCE9D0|tara:strand:- start:63153 stop:64310 length:1158 start_codon:yes stop_codon:yes gene_type:complete
MNKWIALLLVLLGVSLTLNLYLLSKHATPTLFDIAKDTTNQQPQNAATELVKTGDISEPPLVQTKQYSDVLSDKTQLNSASPNRLELLAQGEQWLKDRNFLKLVPFLQDYLKQSPQDMDFLLLEAKVNVETTLLSDAIAHYYDLLRQPMTEAQRNEIENQIQHLSTHTIEQLTRNYSWDILAMFVEPLLQLEPDNRQYILSLAIAYAELFQEGLMENALASLDFDDPDAQRVRQILTAQQLAQSNDETTNFDTDSQAINLGRPIPLKQFGDQYVVDAQLSNNQVALLIDTGASVTAISKQYFDNLSNRYKINYLGSFNIGTAGGSIMARMYQFRELTINHVTVENLPVVVLPMQGIENADGLLGMNFLREFDFKIDQRQSVMFIK